MSYSGENWEYVSEGYTQSIEVIEPPEPDGPRKKGKKKRKAKKVPFGFARALPKQKGAKRVRKT